jgi:hypothetical protein
MVYYDRTGTAAQHNKLINKHKQKSCGWKPAGTSISRWMRQCDRWPQRSPGLWLIIAGLPGRTTRYAECTLGMV